MTNEAAISKAIQAELDRLQGDHPGREALVVLPDKLGRPGIVQVTDGGVRVWGESGRMLDVLRRAQPDDVLDVGEIRGWISAWAALSVFSGAEEQPDVPLRWEVYHRSEAEHGDEYGPGPWFCRPRGGDDPAPTASYPTREVAVAACWEEATRRALDDDEPLH